MISLVLVFADARQKLALSLETLGKLGRHSLVLIETDKRVPSLKRFEITLSRVSVKSDLRSSPSIEFIPASRKASLFSKLSKEFY